VRIAVQRSGGFAGLTEDLGAVDTLQLQPEARARIEGMVHTHDQHAQATQGASGPGADMFTYRITVTEGNNSRTIAFTDDGGQHVAPLRAIVDAVTGQH